MPRPPRRKPLRVHKDETPSKPVVTRSTRSAEKSAVLAPSPLKQNQLPRASRLRDGEKNISKTELFTKPARETRATRGKIQQVEEPGEEVMENDAPELQDVESMLEPVRMASPTMLSRTDTLNINEWTPSIESTPVRASNILAESTPAPRSKKRKSSTAFNETLVEGLKRIREEPLYTSSPPSAQPETRKTERFSTGMTENVEELPKISTQLTTDEDDSINFNYSSSPPRSISEPVLLDRDLPGSSDTELSDTEVDAEEVEQEEPEPPTPAKNTRSAAAKTTKKQQERPAVVPPTQPTQPTTADLKSLMPRRRNPSPKTKRKSAKNSRILKPPVNTTTPRRTSPRKALKDVTSSVIADDDLDDLDNPALQLGEFDDDVQIYVDSSVSSSPLSSPPPSSPYGKKPPTVSKSTKSKRGATTAKSGTNTKVGNKSKQQQNVKAKSTVARGKQRADLIEPEEDSLTRKKKEKKTSVRRGSKSKGTSGGKVTYTRRNSNKENARPSDTRDDDDGQVIDTDQWSDGENDSIKLDKKGTQELNKMKQKFEEVDKWGLEFEDASPRSSSDGVVKGGR